MGQKIIQPRRDSTSWRSKKGKYKGGYGQNEGRTQKRLEKTLERIV